jgi:hypothetical protein
MKTDDKTSWAPKPTERQLQLIADIESELDVSFTGETRQEASKFIDEYIGQYKDAVLPTYNYYEYY